jgi:uncharacterized protein (TIGR02186 family)
MREIVVNVVRGRRGYRNVWLFLSRLPRITTATIFFILFLLIPHPGIAAPLVGDLSNYRIDMDSSFNGTRIFLFGARNDNGDIVVVVRGPQKDYIVRKKEQIAGLWVNRQRMRFWDVPDFYAVASSRKLSDIVQAGTFRRLGIGENNVLAPPADPAQQAAFSEFADAFLRYQHGRRLYLGEPETVSFMGETLFKTTIEFPDDIPPGDYTAEIYLISEGDVMGMQSTPIRVVKTGLDAFLYAYAHDHPAMYGLSAIILALGVGWGAGRVFEKI